MITIPYSKIEKVVGKNDGRPTLESVYFDAKTQTLRAADGFMAAVIPVDVTHDDDGELHDTTGHIPVDAFTTGRKLAKNSRLYLSAKPGHVNMPFSNSNGMTAQWQRPPEMRFPDFSAITPDYDLDDDDTVSVTLDVSRLRQLADALLQNDDNVRKPTTTLVCLTFSRSKPKKVILVEPFPDNGHIKGRFGLLMPVHSPKAES